MGLQCNMLLFCSKTVVRVSHSFGHLKKQRRTKKEKSYFVSLTTFWFSTFVMLFVALEVLLVMKTLKDKWHVVIGL